MISRGLLPQKDTVAVWVSALMGHCAVGIEVLVVGGSLRTQLSVSSRARALPLSAEETETSSPSQIKAHSIVKDYGQVDLCYFILMELFRISQGSYHGRRIFNLQMCQQIKGDGGIVSSPTISLTYLCWCLAIISQPPALRERTIAWIGRVFLNAGV